MPAAQNPVALPAEDYPSHDEVVRARLMDAAVHCVHEMGISKVGMRHIAEAAGLARQTAYKYYPNKYDVLADAFMREGLRFAEQLANHINRIEAVDEQFVEAFLFVIDTLPENPVLMLLVEPEDGFIHHLGISYHPFGLFGELAFSQVFNAHPALAAQAEEISEYWARNVLSFLSLSGTRERSREELAGYVRYRLLPGLHLDALLTR
ncbi:MAG: TetR/AcrR family transcriptional regulator [Gammaproteobacteria bacterium]|nr:MAG: TetR/AcrR family transcriptional regulator [Gammaproteobacteria bacterium]